MLGEAWGSLLGSGVMAGTIVALLLSFLIKLTSHRRRRLEVGLDIDALPKIDEFLRDLAPGVEYYRATATAYWNRGADALYLLWFPWPIGLEQRQILSEIGDPDVLFEKSKRYYMAPCHDQSVKFGYEAPLPVQPRMGADTAPATVSLSVVKDSIQRGRDIDAEAARIDFSRLDECQPQREGLVLRRRDVYDLRLLLLDAGVSARVG